MRLCGAVGRRAVVHGEKRRKRQIYARKTAFIRFVVCGCGCVVRLAVVLWCVVAIAEQNQNLRAKVVLYRLVGDIMVAVVGGGVELSCVVKSAQIYRPKATQTPILYTLTLFR